MIENESEIKKKNTDLKISSKTFTVANFNDISPYENIKNVSVKSLSQLSYETRNI